MFSIFIFISLLVYCSGKFEVSHRKFPNAGRIVGGQAAHIKKYPYQLIFEYKKEQHCGAAIIRKKWAITASHCLFDEKDRLIKTADVVLRAGTSYVSGGGTIHPAKKLISHPKYSPESVDYDIALIEVSEPFIYGNEVQAISLTTQEPKSGIDVVVTGWGAMSSSTQAYPDKLQMVKVKVIDRKTCKRQYAEVSEEITNRMICAGIDKGGKDACFGDSGGPLVANNKLVGVVSWGYECAARGFPGVYANVAVLRAWVFSVIQK